MKARRVPMILVIGAGLLLGLGGLGGVAIERMRFEPQRAAMLAHVEAVVRANQGTPMVIGPSARADAQR
jgi:hypothetical protein